jgi:hypothetical protein
MTRQYGIRTNAFKYFPTTTERKKSKYAPDITAILLDPCSSRAILSASSISNVPNPYKDITEM